MSSDIGRGLPLAGTYKGGGSFFSLLHIIPVMFLVSGDCNLLKSDTLDACYSQVKKSDGREGGKPYHSEKDACRTLVKPCRD